MNKYIQGMDANRKYYVYLHLRKTDGKVFYVGKGKNLRSLQMYEYSRTLRWHNMANKHGVDVELAQDSMLEHEAFLLEMWLIAKFRHEGHPLVNFTNGGEGVSGLKHSDESRRKMSRSAAGRKMPQHVKEALSERWKGDANPSKNMTDEHRRSLSESHKGIKQSKESNDKRRQSLLGDKNHFYGKSHTEDSRAKVAWTKGNKTEYTFISPGGSEITCTLVEMAFGDRNASNGFRNLISGKVKSYKGWECVA